MFLSYKSLVNRFGQYLQQYASTIYIASTILVFKINGTIVNTFIVSITIDANQHFNRELVNHDRNIDMVAIYLLDIGSIQLKYVLKCRCTTGIL